MFKCKIVIFILFDDVYFYMFLHSYAFIKISQYTFLLTVCIFLLSIKEVWQNNFLPQIHVMYDTAYVAQLGADIYAFEKVASNLSLHLQINFHCPCKLTSNNTNVSIHITFNIPNTTNHITRTLQVPWNYHFITRYHRTINLNISLTFTITVIHPLLSQMDMYVFSSTELSEHWTPQYVQHIVIH